MRRTIYSHYVIAVANLLVVVVVLMAATVFPKVEGWVATTATTTTTTTTTTMMTTATSTTLTATSRQSRSTTMPMTTTMTTTTARTTSGITRLHAEAEAEAEVSPPPRRFAQPHTQKQHKERQHRPPQPYGSDSKLLSKHLERLQTAGRKGTKRFVDPCKVFVGNLPFDANATQLSTFILSTMGQSRMVLHSSKVIEDWKTGQSKGYGFVEFIDPIYSTVCMDVCNGRLWKGRPITVNQGKKKDQDNPVWLQKKKQKDLQKAQDAEEKAIASALGEAEDDNDYDEYEYEELDFDEDGIAIFGRGGSGDGDDDDDDDNDLELDAALFGVAAGDDDFDDEEDDGIFLETSFRDKFGDIDPNLNREQRREAARRLKRKKLPHKGFG